MKKISCLLIISILCICLFGCDPYHDSTKTHRLFYTEDFVFQIREENDIAILIDITDKGQEKEVLKVPAFVDGYEVKMIGMRTAMYNHTYLLSDKLKKLYLPYTTWFVYFEFNWKMNILDEFIVAFNYVNQTRCETVPNPGEFSKDNAIYAIGNIKTSVYTQSHFDVLGIEPPSFLSGGREEFILPNYLFYFNYEDSPNEGIYWIDNITENNLKLNPDDPIRENYDFDGWYKESECVNRWNEELTTPNENETCKLYAKWIEKIN